MTSTVIDCPACRWPDITGETCPNCGADLAPLRRLAGLPSEYAREGMELMQSGRLDDAMTILAAAAALDGSSPDIHAALGELYTQRKFFTEATGEFDRALQIDPQNARAAAGKQAVQDAIDAATTAARQAQEAARQSQETARQSQEAERQALEAQRKIEQQRTSRLQRLVWIAPILALLLGIGVFVLIQKWQQPGPPDLGTLATKVRQAIASHPALSGVKTTVEPNGAGLRLAGEVPTAMHVELLKELARNIAGDRVDFSGLETRPEPPPQEWHYKVRNGDSFAAIARNKYGIENLWPAIAELNRGRLREPDKLYPGDDLVLRPMVVNPQ